LGYDAVISENSAFPVNPQASTLDNVVSAVRDRADIMVLMVGARYGTTPSGQGDRSITNLEYLEAKAKGIPTYVFISRRIIHALPIWKENRNADFSKFVDTPKLFEFAEHLRKESSVWVFEFDEAGDIISTLRQQWAILFSDALEVRNKMRGVALAQDLMSLAAEPLSILLKKPRAWEHRLFAAVLRTELQKLGKMRLDLKYGIRVGPVVELGDALAILNWMQTQFQRAIRLIQSAETLTNAALREALGPEGLAGDPALIAYVGRRVADVVRELLQWRCGFQTLSVNKEFERMMELAGEMVNDTIAKLELMPSLLDSEIDKAIAAESEGETYTATVKLVFETTMTPELRVEMARLESAVLQRQNPGRSGLLS
jgi:hypothetical protein